MNWHDIKLLLSQSLSLEVSNTYKNCFGETIVEVSLKLGKDVISQIDITTDKGD